MPNSPEITVRQSRRSPVRIMAPPPKIFPRQFLWCNNIYVVVANILGLMVWETLLSSSTTSCHTKYARLCQEKDQARSSLRDCPTTPPPPAVHIVSPERSNPFPGWTGPACRPCSPSKFRERLGWPASASSPADTCLRDLMAYQEIPLLQSSTEHKQSTLKTCLAKTAVFIRMLSLSVLSDT